MGQTEKDLVRDNTEEAVKAFERIFKEVKARNTGWLLNRLLDDGRRLGGLSGAETREQYRTRLIFRLEEQEKILSTLDILGSKPVEPVVERTVKYHVSPGEGQEALRSEIVTVRFRMPKSARYGSSFREQMGGLTVGEDGYLYLVMRRIGVRWYWNPFGWEEVKK